MRLKMIACLSEQRDSSRQSICKRSRSGTFDETKRFNRARERLSALTAADVQAMAARYLKPEERLEIVVLPRAAAE